MSRGRLGKALKHAIIAGLTLSCLLAGNLHSAYAAHLINWIDRGVVAAQQGHYDDAQRREKHDNEKYPDYLRSFGKS